MMPCSTAKRLTGDRDSMENGERLETTNLPSFSGSKKLGKSRLTGKHDLMGGRAVKSRRWLVQKQDAGQGNERVADGDTTLLTSTDPTLDRCSNPVLSNVAEAKTGDGRADPGLKLCSGRRAR